jgi:hypothetical protein
MHSLTAQAQSERLYHHGKLPYELPKHPRSNALCRLANKFGGKRGKTVT